jgi:hypothetical protein
MWTKEEHGHTHSGGIPEGDATQVPEWVPKLKDVKEELGGKIVWIARGSRMDLQAAYARVASRFHLWERQDDWILTRIFQYLRFAMAIGILMEADSADIDSFVTALFTDTDHNSNPAHTKSSSCALSVIQGPNTKLPIDWFNRRQGSTAQNTTEAEIVGMKDGTYDSALPLTGILEEIFWREIRICAFMDNSAGALAIRKWYSRRLAYLPKTQRCSIGGLHAIYHGDAVELDALPGAEGTTPNQLQHLSGLKNPVDLLTKGHPTERHWDLMQLNGMVQVPGFVASGPLENVPAPKIRKRKKEKKKKMP